jgi:hypothetical protein
LIFLADAYFVPTGRRSIFFFFSITIPVPPGLIIRYPVLSRPAPPAFPPLPALPAFAEAASRRQVDGFPSSVALRRVDGRGRRRSSEFASGLRQERSRRVLLFRDLLLHLLHPLLLPYHMQGHFLDLLEQDKVEPDHVHAV